MINLQFLKIKNETKNKYVTMPYFNILSKEGNYTIKLNNFNNLNELNIVNHMGGNFNEICDLKRKVKVKEMMKKHLTKNQIMKKLKILQITILIKLYLQITIQGSNSSNSESNSTGKVRIGCDESYGNESNNVNNSDGIMVNVRFVIHLLNMNRKIIPVI